MEFQEPIIFWFNKEHFVGTVYEHSAPLTIFSDAEMTALITDILETTREDIAIELGELGDIPKDIPDATYVVFIVGKDGWMQPVGWLDDEPPAWHSKR